MPVPAIPAGLVGQLGPIDHSKLCWDDYWSLVLLPVVGEAFVPFKGKAPDPLGMCKAGLRAAFWYAYDNNWPCCGEADLGDASFDRAEAMMKYMFEAAVVEAAKNVVVPELQAQTEPGGCPDGSPAARSRGRRAMQERLARRSVTSVGR